MKINPLFYFVIIFFLISCRGSQKSTIENPSRGLGENPYILIDSKPVTKEVFRKINPEEISSITVINKKNGEKLYGIKAKHGAILVETIKEQNTNDLDTTNRYSQNEIKNLR